MGISKRIATARPLATTAMHGRVEALRDAGKQVIDFSIAISHFRAPDTVRGRVSQMAVESNLPYTAVRGSRTLRESLSSKVQRENDIDAGPDEIIVTNGAKQAFYEALFVLTDPGDTVIVFRPYWPAYLATAQLLQLNVEIVELPAQLDQKYLDGLPAARLLILNNPHNPSGKVFSTYELELLSKWMLATKCGAIVDESYEKLVYCGSHISLASVVDWRLAGVVTIFSASQSYAMMGWRSGFAVASADIVRNMETLQGPVTAAVSALTQVATEAAFESGEPLTLVADYKIRRDLVVDRFAAVAWAKVISPDSGPYLWCDIRTLGCDTIAFSEELLELHRVAIMPGDALGQPGFIRIGFISDDVETLLNGVDAIVRFGNARAARSSFLATKVS